MDKITIKSLEIEAPSYHIKVVEENVKTEPQIFPSEEEVVPERYNQTKIVFLPVDPYNHFIYWDIENSLYEKLKGRSLKAVLHCCGEKKLEIEINKQYGEYYFVFYAPFEEVFVSLGYYEDGKFLEITKSNRFILPSDMIFEGEEIFVHKKDFKDKEKIKEKLKKVHSSKGKKAKEILSQVSGKSSSSLL